MKSITIIFGLGALALAGCAKRGITHKETFVPVPTDYGEASFGSKQVLGGAKGKWRSRGTANVLAPEQVEAYPVARYQDPGNPNILHERHFVYRKQAQRWNLTPNTSEEVNLGNAPERSRIIDGRLAQKISDVAVRDALITQGEALKSQQRSLAAAASNRANIDQLQMNQRKLAEASAALDRRQKSLEIRERAAAQAERKQAKPEQRESGDKDFYKDKE